MSHLGLLTGDGQVDQEAMTDYLTCEHSHEYMTDVAENCHALAEEENINHFFESWEDYVQEV